MIGTDYIKAQAARIAWQAEHHNGVNGMLGVLFVIRNRANKDHYGDWAPVIEELDHDLAGQSRLVPLHPDVRNPDFTKLLQYVDDVYDGRQIDNLTNGALGWGLPPPGLTERCAKIGSTDYWR